MIICINLLLAFPCFGQEKTIHKIIGNVFVDEKYEGSRYVVVVEKETSTLYLIQLEDKIPVIIKKFNVLLGKDNGDKLKEGDGRTPEGIYFITGFIPPEKLNPLLYGRGAFPLNYPNIVDRIHQKTGHGIWIHGRGTLQRDSTNGCVSIEDNDFMEFMNFVGKETPVVVTNRVIWTGIDEYNHQKSKLRTNILSFLKTWEAGDFESYKNFFAKKYKNGHGEDLKHMLQRKKRLFSVEKVRHITASGFLILQENSKELMYQYRQLYCSDRVLGYGTKRLYLENTPEGYKIIAEEFSSDDPLKALKGALEEFVKQWKRAWQSQDINRYITYYHPEFTSSKGDINGWKRYKAGIFANDHILSIVVSDMKIKILGPALFQVVFTQEYMSEKYYDLGRKTLLIKGCPPEFRIIREKWQGLD